VVHIFKKVLVCVCGSGVDCWNEKSIVTLLALEASDIFNGNFLHFRFRLFHETLVHFNVLLIVLSVKTVVFELDFCFAVAGDTPAHTQCGVLINHIHFLYRTVAFLTFDLTHRNVLGVVEVSVVWKVVDTNPFNRALNFSGWNLL
jgi:hypothetical protein